MPHLDFRQLFPDQVKETATPADTRADSPPSNDRAGNATSKAQSTRWAGHLGPLGWVNVAFVALATLGGLGCAFYFFNGNELFHATTRWSREFLYPQPAAVVAKTDASKRQAAAGPVANSTRRLNNVAPNTAAPFDRGLAPRDLSNPARLGLESSARDARSIRPQTRDESLPSSRPTIIWRDTNSDAQTSSRTVSKSESREETKTAAEHKTSSSEHKSASETTKKIARRTKETTHKSGATSKSSGVATNYGFPVASNIGFEAAFGGGTLDSFSSSARSAHSERRTAQKGGAGAHSTARSSNTSRAVAGFGGTRGGLGMGRGGFRGFGGRMGHGGRDHGGRGR
jgi:hypothetical protein